MSLDKNRNELSEVEAEVKLECVMFLGISNVCNGKVLTGIGR